MTDIPDRQYFDAIGSSLPADGRELPDNANPLNSFSPLVLAYIGDAVFELYIRVLLLKQGSTKVTALHNTSVKYVRAGAQAEFLREIEPLLTGEERDVVRRGRNAKSARTPKSADIQAYHYSTALEALIGYLYLLGRSDRLHYLLGRIAARPKSDD